MAPAAKPSKSASRKSRPPHPPDSAARRPAVLERLPVSEDKSMTVELLAVRPEASPYTQAERGAPIRGGLQWRIQLAAAGKANIEYQYRITFPARTEIVGGNRRD